MISLARILVYPIKGLDGVSLERCRVLETGPLEFDRRFRIVDDAGKVVNGKRTAAIHGIRTQYDLTSGSLTLSSPSMQPAQYSLWGDRQPIETWLSTHFGFSVRLEEDAERGFPDDYETPGPTLVSTATLRQIATWYPGLTAEEVRRRLRANLEIDAPEPFWEDRLVGGTTSRFRLGPTIWRGVRICQRCVVPSRDSQAGEVTPGFQKTFAQLRAANLPETSPPEAFDHFYRVCINTRPEAIGAAPRLHVGDALQIVPVGEPIEAGGAQHGEP